MPEEQKPFITREGRLTGLPSLTPAELLTPPCLATQLAELMRERDLRGRMYPGWISSGRLDDDKAIEQLKRLERAMQTLELLGKPAVNATASAVASLPPADAAILVDIASALLADAKSRPRLILALGSVLEGAS